MEPIKPTATLTSKIRESADGGDAASGTIGGLPFHLTEKILRCISPLESVRFATVCRSWAATISERLATPTPHLFALEVLHEYSHWTQFLLQPDMERHRGAIFSLPIDEEDSPSPVVTARLPAVVSHTKGMQLSGALPCGGLSFVDDKHVVLVNPFTGAFLGKMRAARTAFHHTEPKVRAAAGTNAFFVTEYIRFEWSVSLWWRTEEEWSKQNLLLSQQEFAEMDLVVYSNGVFYGLEFFGCTYTVDTRVPPPWRLTELHVPSILEQYSPVCGYKYLRNSHLLESEGEVMFVGPVLAPAPQEPTICGFEVYRLDVEGARWVKVERLAGDQALFVSEQSSFTVRASETPGCMSNCIYFVGEVYECYCVTWGVYSMEERKVLFQRPVGGSPGKYDAARWFLPGVVAPLAH